MTSPVSPPIDQSKRKDGKDKIVDSVPPKPPQKIEKVKSKAEGKLMADNKNSQVTNRTAHGEKGNTVGSVVGGNGKNAKSAKETSEEDNIPTIFGITPTYRRNTQKVDLTSLCQTLMLVPRVVWIVVEDATEKSDLVKKFLQRCKVESIHMNVKSPPKQRSRGVLQRNAGLNWIRQHCAETKCNGVVYFMDDDNKYDLRLFEEVRTRDKGGWGEGEGEREREREDGYCRGNRRRVERENRDF
jgi:galactosylgalactosylxylosylprotein 3-beta-glucuronosyltransferase 3